MLQATMLKREQKMNQDLENLVRQRTQELLSANKEMGVSSSIDDFGTGYSSLSYIKKFSVDRLKIAKELVDNIENDENTSLIVNTIIKMAKGLNLKTIAEGVEDITQLEIIENLGCDEIQGFIFGKSVPPDTFETAHILPIKKQVMFSPVSSIL
ncbi:EAL domain-containing protein [Criibacterium bergeronii]|uniref:EAL domain-containing protein n=2 Tax=Criibacterium bergeronii TaxID=1871336 RepID=A0A552VDR8_9FIRM|nr:EAL domain-containing protein [Criibacterium bergeronii]